MSELANHLTSKGAVDRSPSPACPWSSLFDRDVDAMVDELCAGRPRDFVADCREHVEDNAYFIEDGRLAAKVIAAVVACAGTPLASALATLETVIEESTSEILDEGPLGPEDVELSDDPSDTSPGLAVQLSRRLGVEAHAVLRVIPILNALEFDVRHVAYHCLARGLPASEYAERFDVTRRWVQAQIDSLVALAVRTTVAGAARSH